MYGLNLWCVLNLGFSYFTKSLPKSLELWTEIESKSHTSRKTSTRELTTDKICLHPNLLDFRLPSIPILLSMPFSVFVSLLLIFFNFLTHNSVIYRICIWNSMRAQYFQFSLVTKYAKTPESFKVSMKSRLLIPSLDVQPWPVSRVLFSFPSSISSGISPYPLRLMFQTHYHVYKWTSHPK